MDLVGLGRIGGRGARSSGGHFVRLRVGSPRGETVLGLILPAQQELVGSGERRGRPNALLPVQQANVSRGEVTLAQHREPMGIPRALRPASTDTHSPNHRGHRALSCDAKRSTREMRGRIRWTPGPTHSRAAN